jgi:hypothetical protein
MPMPFNLKLSSIARKKDHVRVAIILNTVKIRVTFNTFQKSEPALNIAIKLPSPIKRGALIKSHLVRLSTKDAIIGTPENNIKPIIHGDKKA